MYKIFINNKPLFIIDKLKIKEGFQLFLLRNTDLNKIITKFFQNKIQGAFLYHPNKSEMIDLIKIYLPIKKAAGGLVYNDKGEVLFIHRNGLWDLPKGGKDKGETHKEAAIREVEEETGVRGLSIDNKLMKTYHIFKNDGEYKLKITKWYLMHTKYKGKLVGQKEEGIDKAEWMEPEKIKKIINKSYENIKMLLKSENLI